MELPNARASAQQRAALESLRHALLKLHKTLLEWQRVRYEREHGRVADGYPLLDKVMNDPAFAWLRPLSALIVQLDENLENTELTQTGARLLNDHARQMVTPSESSTEFQRNYHRALQDSPAAVMAHREVSPLFTSGRTADH